MNKREFVFEIKEIITVYDGKMTERKRDIVNHTSGIVWVKGEDITVLVDDKNQPCGMFEAKDSLFKRIIKNIHNATKPNKY